MYHPARKQIEITDLWLHKKTVTGKMVWYRANKLKTASRWVMVFFIVFLIKLGRNFEETYAR
jgi:hypothetical protein